MQIYTDSIRFEPDLDLVTTDSEILMINPQARIEADHAEFRSRRTDVSIQHARSVYHHEDS